MDFATELLTVDEIRERFGDGAADRAVRMIEKARQPCLEEYYVIPDDRAQAEIDEIFSESNVVDCGEDTCAREPECDYHAGDLVEFPDDEEDEDEIR
jgi:hypothetical protein